MMTRLASWLAPLTLGALLLGCGSSSSGGKTDASTTNDAPALTSDGTSPIADGAIGDAIADAGSPGDGAIVDVSVATDTMTAADAGPIPDAPAGSPVVGPEGGMLMLAGSTLTIPAGALTTPTAIAFHYMNTDFPAIPGNSAPLSSVIALEPHGQTFAKPVTLVLNHFGGMQKVALYTAQPHGKFTEVTDAVLTDKTATAQLSHFSFFVVAPAVTTADAGAPDAAPSMDAASSAVTIKVRGETLSFDPEGIEVPVGTTVTWVWEASGHSVESGGVGVTASDCAADGKFTSGAKNTGDTFSYTFTAPGTYGYHCAAHCAQHEGGIVTVK